MQRVLDPIAGRHVISTDPAPYQDQILRAPLDEELYYVRRSPSPSSPTRTMYVEELPEPEPVVYHTRRYVPPEPSTIYVQEKTVHRPVVHNWGQISISIGTAVLEENAFHGRTREQMFPLAGIQGGRSVQKRVESVAYQRSNFDLMASATAVHPTPNITYIEKPPSYHSETPLSSSTTAAAHAQSQQRVIYEDKVHPVVEQRYYRNNQWEEQRTVREDRASRYQRGVTRKRGCLAILAGILVLLLLAGIAVGLYFGIKAAQTQSAVNAASNKVRGGYSGGYYINGVYVVPVTTKPFNTYLIYGTETPCNPYNNSTLRTRNIYYPDCDEVTTRIVKVNWSTTTPKTVYVYYNGGAEVLRRASWWWTGLISAVVLGCKFT